MIKLTSQQEAFAQKVAEGLSQSDAYRFAYPKSKKWTDETLWPRASKLAAEYKVLTRIKELQVKAAQKCAVTVESLVKHLDEVRIMALEDEKPQCAAAVNAIMAQAKLLGLDKQLLEVTGSGMPLINVTFVKPDAADDC